MMPVAWLSVALYGGGLAFSEHIQTARHGILAPLEQFLANRRVDCVGAHGVHCQVFRIVIRLVITEEMHPQCVVI